MEKVINNLKTNNYRYLIWLYSNWHSKDDRLNQCYTTTKRISLKCDNFLFTDHIIAGSPYNIMTK
jgi:hypothetical protein